MGIGRFLVKSTSKRCMESTHAGSSVHRPRLSKGYKKRENEFVGSLFQEFAFLGGRVHSGIKIPPFVKDRVEFGLSSAGR